MNLALSIEYKGTNGQFMKFVVELGLVGKTMPGLDDEMRIQCLIDNMLKEAKAK